MRSGDGGAGAGNIAQESLLCLKYVSSIKEKIYVLVTATTATADPAATKGGEGKFIEGEDGSGDIREPYLPTSESCELFDNAKLLWPYLLGQTSEAVTKGNLVRVEHRDMFPVVDREEVGEPWRRAIWLKVQKNT